MNVRARLFVVAAALTGLFATGCFEFHQLEVRNQTPNIVLVSVSIDCADSSRVPARFQTIEPGTRFEGFALNSLNWHFDCLQVRDVSNREIYAARVPKGGIFEVRGVREPTVTRIRDGKDYDLGFAWALIFLVPLLLGFPVALLITARYFYRYYVSKTIA